MVRMILPEIVTVGIYNSDIAARNTVISKNRKTSMFEIELPIEDGGVSFIDANSRLIRTNMIICAKPGQDRHTKFPFKCYYVHMIIHDEKLYNTLINTPDFFEIENADTYKALFEKLIDHYNKLEDNEAVLLQSLILELIYKISKDSNTVLNKAHSQRNGMMMEEVLIYIKEHLTEDLSLKKVSDFAAVSPIYFHNIFKRSVGKTLREYVEEQRIKQAIHLLLSTDESLTRVAFECGFSSQSYFSYVFKRKMGKTPRDYVRGIYSKYGQ